MVDPNRGLKTSQETKSSKRLFEKSNFFSNQDNKKNNEALKEKSLYEEFPGLTSGHKSFTSRQLCAPP